MKLIFFLFAIVVAITNCSITYSVQKISEKEKNAALAYWTPERMRSAIPMEMLMKAPKELSPEALKEAFTSADPDTDYVPREHYTQRPYAQSGRVFFNYKGRPASCSGSSTGGNAVITAGHCVFLEGEFHTDWVFVPQYYNGSAPHGVWVANKVMIFDEWKSQHMGRDVAFAITDKKNGKSLSEVVGYLEAAACDPDNSEKITAIGYPMPDYGAEKMVRTHDHLRMRFRLGPWKPEPIGIRSKMGPGSSGGPWVMKFDLGSNAKDANICCSVNSFGVRFTYYVFGPFFDEKVLEMRKEAISQ